eukprot:CAMPEP_0178418828 /NCGR_PEP_ID=MMETSP0689_2-20121128/25291_1 /TAXON_ID=160604 /ORGANISM="Amphidinium massartii, Strain CS-259" /LENGTH=268 /DNA_ID=CAMNT_0020040237 /DNA_START=1 /DNA_END=810 /DNA_ORIENTATION=+
MASCTSYTCPSGYIGRSDADALTCRSSPCTEADKETCCIVSQNQPPSSFSDTSLLSCSSNVESIACALVGSSSSLAGRLPSYSSVMSCPSSCTTAGTAYGTGVYEMSSSICVAAIHSGVITVGGGTLKVTVQDGLPAYYGSEQNGVTSLSHAPANSSFLVSIPAESDLASCLTSTTTDMPWGWPWWAWFILCSSSLFLLLLLGGLYASMSGGSSSKKKKKSKNQPAELTDDRVSSRRRSRDLDRIRDYEVVDVPVEQQQLLSPRSGRR